MHGRLQARPRTPCPAMNACMRPSAGGVRDAAMHAAHVCNTYDDAQHLDHL